ncbi:MAG: Mrp/NBP35 family ATP-binding protein [Actinobacteria bacterium]|nr:Mrp/NBP35 family ATP-binding protein [Actinomycetota bacterium]
MHEAEAAVRSAIADIDEPRLRRPLAELGVVQGVAVDGATAVVALADPLPRSESWDELARRVDAAVGALAGIDRVDVDIREMTDEEKARAANVLKGAPPPDPLAVVDASAQRTARPRTNPFTDARTRVLAIASGKGGVGKSSVTTNLSIALAERGRDVAVVDADVWGFSLPRMFGVAEPPGLIDDVLVPPETHGVRVISMGFFTAEDQAVMWRGPMLHKALEQFLTDVHWGEPEYLVVDLPPGTGDISLSIAQFLPRAEVIVVTTPQPAAQKVAQRAAAMAEKVELDVIGIIENMSWFRGDDGKQYELFGAGGGAELAVKVGVPLLGQVPLVPALREGGDEGDPIVIARPDDEASQAFRAIAEIVDRDIKPRRRAHPELKIS